MGNSGEIHRSFFTTHYIEAHVWICYRTEIEQEARAQLDLHTKNQPLKITYEKI